MDYLNQGELEGVVARSGATINEATNQRVSALKRLTVPRRRDRVSVSVTKNHPTQKKSLPGLLAGIFV